MLAWFACVLLIGSTDVWIPFDVDVGANGFLVVFALIFAIPLVALPIARRWPRRVLGFVAIATLFAVATLLATAVGITPRNPSL